MMMMMDDAYSSDDDDDAARTHRSIDTRLDDRTVETRRSRQPVARTLRARHRVDDDIFIVIVKGDDDGIVFESGDV